MLVRMLRTEVGEVYNRAAWGDSSLLTPDIRELYKEPLRLQGWDSAILEVLCFPLPLETMLLSLLAQHAVASVTGLSHLAVLQVIRARKVGRKKLLEYFNMVQDLPALVVTGARDR